MFQRILSVLVFLPDVSTQALNATLTSSSSASVSPSARFSMSASPSVTATVSQTAVVRPSATASATVSATASATATMNPFIIPDTPSMRELIYTGLASGIGAAISITTFMILRWLICRRSPITRYIPRTTSHSKINTLFIGERV